MGGIGRERREGWITIMEGGGRKRWKENNYERGRKEGRGGKM